jgi:putative ABC transport system permease protein
MGDLSFSWRALRRNPGFTILSVLTLTLGVGANTAIFSVVEAVLLNQLPYRDPDRLVVLGEADQGEKRPGTIGYTTAYDWRRMSHSFTGMSLYRGFSGAMTERGEAELLNGMRVNYDFFDTLGVAMQLGRTFLPEEDRPEGRYEIILSDGLWKRRFGGDPNILGRSIRLSDSSFRVVGVLPASFRTLEIPGAPDRAEIFAPLGYALSEPNACRDCQHLRLIGRLKPGVSPQQAHAELKAIMSRLVPQYPQSYPPHATAALEPLREHLVGPASKALWVLMGAVGFVLLIACANVANLMLVRSMGRSREIALRAALGAGRWRLMRQLLAESLLLAAAAGLAGVVLASWCTSTLAALGPREIPRMDQVRMDPAVLLFCLGASLLTGVLFGLAPALRASRVDLNEALKDLGKSTAGRSRQGLRNLLVAGEVALAFVLVVGAGLLGKSFLRLLNVNSGYDPHQVLTVRTFVYGERYAPAQATLGYYQQVMDRVRALPGVEAVGMTSVLPLANFDRRGFHIRDRRPQIASDMPSADTYSVTPDYFRAMRIPLLRGRSFTDRDGPADPKVVIISEACARQQFPGEDALGKQIQLGGRNDDRPWATIVGVVGDIHQYGLEVKPNIAAYIAQAQDVSFGYSLVVRTAGDPLRMEHGVREAFTETDRVLPIFDVRTMESYTASAIGQRRFTLLLIGLFGAVALALAAVGIYGVIAYTVTLRVREMGIRMALGAKRRDVVAMVLRNGAALAAVGLAAGFIASLGLMRLLTGLLFEVRPIDLAISSSVALGMASVALLASYLPARRAARIDPAIALRYE